MAAFSQESQDLLGNGGSFDRPSCRVHGSNVGDTLQQYTDIATLMTFIEPGHPSSREQWWKAATEQGAAKMVVKEIKSWSDNYLIRRGKDVIAVPLPRKTVGHVSLSLSGAEMSV